MRFLIALGGLTVLLSGCPRDLTLPPPPDPSAVPRISKFTARAAFGGDTVYVYGENFDKAGNLLEFPGGQTVLADSTDAGDTLYDGGLGFTVPDNLAYEGPLLLSNTRGRSEPSPYNFIPLGTGHPNEGTPVAQLRFRHNPVGLVDQESNVLMGSSIFDLVVTDGKAFAKVPGRPLALKRSPRDRSTTGDGRGLLSVSLPGREGKLLEVNTDDGSMVATSEASDTRELFILPPFDAATAIARTIGVDATGKYWFSTWAVSPGAPGEPDHLMVSSRRDLQFAEIVGAAALGAQVSVVARDTLDPNFSIWTVTTLGQSPAWAAMTGPGCETSTGPKTECEPPDGPITVVAPATMGDPPLVVASLRSGDLVVLSGTSARTIKLISYASINALSATITPGKVLITKGVDGALFQYDLLSTNLDWSVQLRGEPSVIDVSPSIDEIAVGNRFDNAVDTIEASTGTWTGRIAFNLGVGSANGLQGGIVPPYSYNPEDYDGGSADLVRMDLLMRNVGLVVSIDASSLEIIDHLVLDRDGGVPVRLAVTKDLHTLVLHANRVGVIEPVADSDSTEREERLVTPVLTPDPVDFFVLPRGEVVITFLDRVRWYQWTDGAQGRVLSQQGELRLPMGTRLIGAVPNGDDVMVTWINGSGRYGGGTYALSNFASGQGRALAFNPKVTELVGLATMRDGPVEFVMTQDTPMALEGDELWNGSEPLVSSVINRKRVSGTSPDGRYVFWLDEGSAEPMARLVTKDSSGNWVGYSTYRLAGHAAGPSCDPSGQWLYLPVPLLDQLEVVK